MFASEQLPIFIRKTSEIAAFREKYLGSSLLVVPAGNAERIARFPDVSFDLWDGSFSDTYMHTLHYVSLGHLEISNSRTKDLKLLDWRDNDCFLSFSLRVVKWSWKVLDHGKVVEMWYFLL